MRKKLVSTQSKIPTTGQSIFSTMSALAQKYGAINLSQGFPNFDSSMELSKLVHQYMSKGYQYNQYAPMPGLLSLRQAIANKIEHCYKNSISPETEITITAGATQAIYTAITALIRENDEVIVFEPAYDSYVPAIQLNGGKTIPIQLKAPDYKIPWDAVKRVMNIRTRMIILNNPHNPTGAVLSKNDIVQLYRLVNHTDIILLFDEVYEHMVFDKQEHLSVLRYPDLFNRSIGCFSFGKTFHNTGWKVGYCVAPDYLSSEIRRIHQFVVFSVNTPVQHALADYLQNAWNYEYINDFYEQKRNYFLYLIDKSRFKAYPTRGSYYQLLDYSEICQERDVDFAKRLTVEFGIAAIPISVFYNNKLDEYRLRFCFAKRPETLEKAAAILCNI